MPSHGNALTQLVRSSLCLPADPSWRTGALLFPVNALCQPPDRQKTNSHSLIEPQRPEQLNCPFICRLLLKLCPRNLQQSTTSDALSQSFTTASVNCFTQNNKHFSKPARQESSHSSPFTKLDPTSRLQGDTLPVSSPHPTPASIWYTYDHANRRMGLSAGFSAEFL